ncbi:MAG: DUF349 domain-containing protein [Betaproteobacteria bacterium]|nr:DUF349 domain-containing protein [Betaproteobacteria bacterium]
MNLTDHAQAIQALRQRWKELDRLSAAAPQTLWQRFDAALQTAHAPVAAQQAALQAAREENLAAREPLLAGLDALPLPPHPAHAADPAAATPGLRTRRPWNGRTWCANCTASSWRGASWGRSSTRCPPARQGLQQRLRDSLARIEQPLQALRQVATGERERLIAEAQALVARTGQPVPWHEAARQVRDLQSAWQHHARQLPLPRALESDLWALQGRHRRRFRPAQRRGGRTRRRPVGEPDGARVVARAPGGAGRGGRPTAAIEHTG